MFERFSKLDMVGILFVKDLNVKGTRGHSLKLEKLGCTIARVEESITSHTK